MAMIPKSIYVFWQGPMPFIVRFCIDRMRAMHGGGEWSVTVLDGESSSSSSRIIEPVDNFDVLSVQAKSDWVRLCALLQNGGVWLDASCICTAPVDRWVDMRANAMQGFSAPFADDALESWAFAAPSGSRLLVRWKEIFREAIVLGFGSFKRRVPQYIRDHAIFGYMPYLTIHACYLMAARETGERALLSPSCEGPFRYLCERGFRPAEVVRALMHHPLPDAPPLIKLRGAEAKEVDRTECRAGSFMHRLGVAVSSPRRHHQGMLLVVGWRHQWLALASIIIIFISVLAAVLILRKPGDSRRTKRML